MTNILICDVDGVLLNWRDSYIEWLKRFNLLSEMSPEDYNFKDYITIPGDNEYKAKNSKFADALSEIYNTSYSLRKLPPIEGAKKALQDFHNNGWIIKVVSSYTRDYEAMKSREENLTNVFGPIFSEIVSLPLMASKKEWLNTQNKQAVFVEDSINNIGDAISVGFSAQNCFLIPHTYNKIDVANEDYYRMSWNNIRKHLLEN